MSNRCNTCHKQKEVSEFGITPAGNVRGQCKQCGDDYDRRRYRLQRSGEWRPTFHRSSVPYMTANESSCCPTTTDLYWASGFLEAEGHFIRGNTLTVGSGQKNDELLLRLQRFFGGSVSFHQNHKYPTFGWVIYGPRAHGVMLTLYPLLSIRRQNQIRKALGFSLLPDFVPSPRKTEELPAGSHYCIKCNSVRPVEEFNKVNEKPLNTCRSCKNIYLKARYEGLKEGSWKPGKQGKVERKIATPEAIRQPTHYEIAWTAGFLDGKASFRGKSGLEMHCPQVNIEPLYKLQELFGGSVSPKRSNGISNWRACGERAKRVMFAIYPYLSKRRQEQIDLLLHS